MGRFETEVLTQRGNLAELTKLSGKWIDRLRERQPMRELILDKDSSVSETYGEQEGTAYNGHFGCTCYHPLFCFNQFGDVEQAVLPQAVRHWTLTTLREKLIKIGAKVARHSRKIVFQMAEVAVPREVFRAILEGIGRLRLATAPSG
jgi:hypothetical protein